MLDPPAFAKTKRVVPTALKGYKELNLRALKMLRPGGTLVTCSCSFHVSEGEFLEMLGSAAADAGRRVRVLEKRGAAARSSRPAQRSRNGVPEVHHLPGAVGRSAAISPIEMAALRSALYRASTLSQADMASTMKGFSRPASFHDQGHQRNLMFVDRPRHD